MWLRLFIDFVLIVLSGGVGYQLALLQVRRVAWKVEQTKLARKKKAAEKVANKRRSAATEKSLDEQIQGLKRAATGGGVPGVNNVNGETSWGS